ncbi:glycosyltransferase family 15 protein [Calocera cornea HHB12733]|uniref:Glycosyltransferase family 15 protein n=1 Tax=Calocera cornea HHB12733 TaxID=1353952 RepID=A0A165EPM9_9BASI|nr:glycosyltransferase family 15 protein [Calocera cornea HHB12733]
MARVSTRLPVRHVVLFFLACCLLLAARRHVKSLVFRYTQTSFAPYLPLAPYAGCAPSSGLSQPREKAAILLLLREADLPELLPTLQNFESKFNGAFRYPYVLLSTPDEEPFSPEFRTAVAGVLPDGAGVEYAQVGPDDWGIPDWLNATEVREGFAEQGAAGVQYGGREGYHHMCRFYAGLFARQEVLQKYDWYWRLEPGVRFYCRISYDPFRFLALRNQVYGFVITIVETANTIPTLFSALSSHISAYNLSPASSTFWHFLTRPKHDSQQGEYNMCHFWTNFEIGDLRFFRGEEYQALFDSLDKEGGFYTERWGDAPVRTLALGLLADTDRVHYFEDFAYKHDQFLHCPPKKLGCECDCPAFDDDANRDIDRNGWYSCVPEWREAQRLDPVGRWVEGKAS